MQGIVAQASARQADVETETTHEAEDGLRHEGTTMSKRTTLTALLALLALVATACGGTSREGAIDELVSEGIQESTANCIMDEVEAAGFTADDVADPINPDVEPIVEDSMSTCITDADVPGLLGLETIEEVEEMLAQQIADTGAMTTEQASCVIDSVLGAGFALTDIAGLGAGAEDNGVSEALAAAGSDCIS